MDPSHTVVTTAIAAHAGWSVVQMALRLHSGDLGYEKVVAEADPLDVRIWLTPIVGWAVEVVPSAEAPLGDDRPSATVTAITPGGVTGDDPEIVRGPDGHFYDSKGTTWETEDQLRSWFLDERRKALADDATERNPNLGIF